MSERREEPESAPESRPLLSTRALVIIMAAVLIGGVVAIKPGLAIPLGVSVAAVTLLVKIVGD
ncbi:hypothetical protein [Actinomadura sp. 6N118]|uniref:hypothetical protein n=1 Tax=Actinomadura sp. 6N118 TaxID=3375151 RepID=UPI00378F6B4E